VEETWELAVVSEEEFNNFCEEHGFRLQTFLEEISTRADYVSQMGVSLNQILNADHSDNGPAYIHTVFWPALYSLTIYASQISYCLGGTGNINVGDRERGSSSYNKWATRYALRSLLGIQGNHAVLNRDLRNRFIHMDEDIDKFFEAGGCNIVRRIIGPPGVINFQGTNSEEFSFEHYDPATATLYYRGQKYSISDIFEAVQDVRAKVPVALQKLQEIMVCSG
jgi:hypothetical protein